MTSSTMARPRPQQDPDVDFNNQDESPPADAGDFMTMTTAPSVVWQQSDPVAPVVFQSPVIFPPAVPADSNVMYPNFNQM